PMERFGLRNDQWERIKNVLPGREGHVGGTAEDNRLFVKAVLYRFDADSLIDDLDRRAITAVIPPKANRKVKRDCDFALYGERNLVERFFNKIKHYRAIATRY